MSSSPLPPVVVATAPVPISADGSALLEHGEESRLAPTGSVRFDVQVASHQSPSEIRVALRQFFEIDATTRFIRAQKCARVGLQFPDELMPHATAVVREIKEEFARMAQEEQTTTSGTEAVDASSSSPASLLLYILADTSYGSCCIDEVAAQHANCDLIVHYGFSCLSRTRRMPARYVFGRKQIDIDALISKVFDDAAWQPEPENSSSSFSFSFSAPDPTPAVDPATLPPVPLLFLYNLEYAHLVAEGELPRRIEAHLAQRGEAGRKYVVAVARVEQEQGRTEGPAGPAPVTTCATGGACCKSSAAPPAAAATSCGCATPSAECAPASVTSPSTSIAASPSSPSSPPLVFSSPSALPSSSEPLESFYLNGYSFSLPHSLASSKDLFQRVQVVWIGSDADYQLLTNCMLVYNSNTFHLYNPSTKRLAKEIKSKSKTLARRYYLMEKAKNADIVGILVGTLGVANYLSVIHYLQRLLRNAGKKSYLFVVGKLNEPKLSNFAEIDLFVLVACPLNTMFDSTGYYSDVVTPFELNCALKGVEWNGDYRTDFNHIMPKTSDATVTVAAPAAAVVEADEEDESLSDDLARGMRFDPITGKMRSALPSQMHAKGIRLDSEEGDDADAGDADSQLAELEDQQLVRVEGGALVRLKTASDHFLSRRTFTGLLMKHEGEGDNDVATILPGLSGIARNYTETALAPAPVQTNATTSNANNNTQ